MFNEIECSLFDNEWTFMGWMHNLKSWTLWRLPQTSTKSWEKYSSLIRRIHLQYFRSTNFRGIQGICGFGKEITCHSVGIRITGNFRNTNWSMDVRDSRCWIIACREWMVTSSIALSKESINVSVSIGIFINSLGNIVK